MEVGALAHFAKKKTGIFDFKTLIIALFGPFYGKNFRRFSVKGGGVPPLSAKGFLAK